MYSAYITELDKIREHPKADTLVIAEVFYTDVVIKKDVFKLGDKVVYFPTDGVLNEDFCKDNNLLRSDGGYIHENRRVKAISLRGVKSDGLIMPIDVLSKYIDTNELKSGDQINVINGVEICKKYIPGTKGRPKGPSHTPKKKHGGKYLFPQHKDTNQLRYNLNNFKEGDELILTEKVHGCFDSKARVRLFNKKDLVRISTIKKGDIVVGYKNNKIVPSKVLNVFKNGKTKNWVEVIFTRKGLGKQKIGKIKCTPNHRFFRKNKRDFMEIKDFKIGDEIFLLCEDKTITNVQKQKYKIPEEFQNIEIEDNLDNEINEVCYTFQNNPQKILEINNIKMERGTFRYDLETETGNYVVSDCLVHNSSGRSSNALKKTNRSNFLSKLLRLYLKPKEEYEYIMGSRRVNIPLDKIDEKEGFHGGNNFRLKAHNKLSDKIYKGECWYYEISGYDDNGNPIMPKVSNEKLKDKEFIKRYGDITHFKYNINSGNDIWVYRITMVNPDGIEVDYSWDQVKYRCDQVGVKSVPELDRFYFTTIDDLVDRVDKLVDGPSTIDRTHLREGVVVRVNNRPGFSAYKDKNMSFKILEGIIKTDSKEPDMEEAEEAFIE